MYKKLIAVILAFSCVVFFPMQSNAAEENLDYEATDEIITSIGLISYGTVSCSTGTKLIHIKMDTVGTESLNEVGFKEIQIQRYGSSGWYTEKTISSVITTNAYSYYLSDYTASVLGGYYYRVVLNHYAKKGSTTERVGNTSNSVWIA